jgi:hypothetical protein
VSTLEKCSDKSSVVLAGRLKLKEQLVEHVGDLATHNGGS